MFINKKYHILSDALLQTAAINLGKMVITALVRLIFRNNVESGPDMLNANLAIVDNVLSAIKVVLIAIVFIVAYKKLMKVRSIVPKDDYSEMAKLQEELNPKGVTTLSTYSIYQLLQVWTAILVVANLLQELGGAMYQKFIAQLSASFARDRSVMQNFVSIYNGTHGFKYVGMLTALLIGVFVTGIFLGSKRLRFAAAAIMGIFALSFAVFQMYTVSIAGKTIGIVWTAVIFHLTETVGLLVLALFLRKRYYC
ncbi:MAG: hypothetical protein K6A23_09700 [Butyrivibrio sp.]|nr:hypothetical protein [Butyrivibrio sp.]